jgi:chromosome segregation ATPase
MSTENAATQSDVRNIRSQVEEQKKEFWDKIEDIREKIIILKKDIDSKADQEHEHSEYVGEETLESEISRIESQIEELSDKSIKNEDLNEEFSEKLDILASNLLSVRDRVGNLEAERRERMEKNRRIKKIMQDARKNATTKPKCRSCGKSVRMDILREPECPHCSGDIEGIESRFLFSDVLITNPKSESEEDNGKEDNGTRTP